MQFRKTNRSHDQLTRRLREAADGAPEFSEVLHTKIMAGIRQRRVGYRSDGIFSFGPHLAALRILAVAAVLLAAVGGWWLSTGVPKKTGVSYASRHTPAVLVSGSAEALYPGWLIRPLAQLMREKIEHARYAYLNQDARNLASFLVRELDITPNLGKRHRRKVGF